MSELFPCEAPYMDASSCFANRTSHRTHTGLHAGLTMPSAGLPMERLGRVVGLPVSQTEMCSRCRSWNHRTAGLLHLWGRCEKAHFRHDFPCSMPESTSGVLTVESVKLGEECMAHSGNRVIAVSPRHGGKLCPPEVKSEVQRFKSGCNLSASSCMQCIGCRSRLATPIFVIEGVLGTQPRIIVCGMTVTVTVAATVTPPGHFRAVFSEVDAVWAPWQERSWEWASGSGTLFGHIVRSSRSGPSALRHALRAIAHVLV